MKYERITSRNEEPFYAFDACKECEQKDECDKWCTYTVRAYTRLHELEDKIENGELIERTSEECSAVRKQAVKEFADEFKRRYFFMMTTHMKCPIYQCTEEEFDRLVKEISETYGVSVEDKK